MGCEYMMLFTRRNHVTIGLNLVIDALTSFIFMPRLMLLGNNIFSMQIDDTLIEDDTSIANLMVSYYEDLYASGM